jgi:WD40 repeat protein
MSAPHVRLALALNLLLAVAPGRPAVAAEAARPRTDRYGDPLPAGALARVGTVRFRHSASVRAVAFSGDGAMLASYGYDALRIWDPANGKELFRLEGVAHGVLRKGASSVVSPDGKLSAEINPADTVQLKDRKTGKVIHTWCDTPYPISGVAFSPDGKRLAAAASGRVRVWDVATGKEVDPAPEHRDHIRFMALSPDGKTLVTEGYDPALPGKNENGIDGRHVTLPYWDAATGKQLPPPPGRRPHFPPPLQLSPDGRALVCRGKGGNLELWGATTGRLLHVLPHDLPVRNGAFSPDGRLLASWGPDGRRRENLSDKLWLWDVPTGKGLGELEGHQGSIWSARFSPDGQLLASCGTNDGTLRLWEVGTRRQLHKLPLGSASFGNLAFSPDGRLLVGSGNVPRPFGVWEVASGSELRVPGFQAIQARQPWGDYGLVFTPDGRSVISSEVNGELFCWDLSNGRLRGQWQADARVYRLALSADGGVLASLGDFGILVWDLSGLIGEKSPAALPLREQELKALWADLAGADAGTAYRAVWRLARSPGQAVPFLGGRLRPASPDRATLIRRLVANLDSDSFAEREKAERQLLEAVGRQAEAELRRALAGLPSPELRMRAQRLLRKLGESPPPPEELRCLRAVAALEHAGTPQARQLLKRLAEGAENDPLTQSAKGSLKRLVLAAPENRAAE